MKSCATGIFIAAIVLAGCVSRSYQSQDQSLIQQSVRALYQNDWDRTEAVASVALEINPKNAQAAYMLALVHEHYGRDGDANRMYRRIIELGSEDTVPAGLMPGRASAKLTDIARQKLGLIKALPSDQAALSSKPADSDGDGILDLKDRCADTPSGARVDRNGCWTLQGLFGSGMSQIKAQAYPMLDDVLAMLNANPKLRIEIQGHTDSRGTYRHNLRLSRVRAEKVVQYLRHKGVAANRLTATGYGPNRPRGLNDTASGRALNRRIEIRVLDQ
jgi:outer membrane protein OmpA-like peptidoglycan-associated protein